MFLFRFISGEIQGISKIFQRLLRCMRIYFGCFAAAMPQYLLYNPQISAIFKGMRGK